MPRLNQLLATISSIYEAGLGQVEWPDVLDRIARFLGSPLAAVGISSATCRFSVVNESWSTIRPLDRSLKSAIYCFDPAHVGELNIRDSLIPVSMSGVLRRQSLANLKGMEILRTIVFQESDYVGIFALARPFPFETAHLRSVGVLSKHIGQAIQIQINRATADTRNDYLSKALDTICQGVIVVDANAQILYANQEAEDIIASQYTLRARGGHKTDRTFSASHPTKKARREQGNGGRTRSICSIHSIEARNRTTTRIGNGVPLPESPVS